MSDANLNAASVRGSCLICGYDKPWVVWTVDDDENPAAGVCEDCKRGADRERGLFA